MERAILSPFRRGRSTGTEIWLGRSRFVTASSRTFQFLEVATKQKQHFSTARIKLTTDDDHETIALDTKLWAILEDDIAKPVMIESNSKGPNHTRTHNEKIEQYINALSTSADLLTLDERWRKLYSENIKTFTAAEKTQLLVARSLAISRLCTSSYDLNRVRGAMNRVLNDVSKDSQVSLDRQNYLLVFNTGIRSFVNTGIGSVALDMILKLRQDQGSLFPNTRSYALAIASSLTSKGSHDNHAQLGASADKNILPVQLEKTKESVLRSILEPFKARFGWKSDISVPAEPDAISRDVLSKDPLVTVISMLKEDFEAGNNDADFTQELFDHVLVCAPSMSGSISRVMANYGFAPTPTSFLALLHSAMDNADANQALKLLSVMLERKIPRSQVHYIATAATLAEKASQDDARQARKHTIRPWYLTALLDGFKKDFPGKPLDPDFVDNLVRGFYYSPVSEQENQFILGLLDDIVTQRLVLDESVCGMLIDRLAVLSDPSVMQKIVNWMNDVNVVRGLACDNGFLRYYIENLVRTHRSLDAKRKQQNGSIEGLDFAPSEYLLYCAEKLVVEMLPDTKGYVEFKKLLQERTQVTPAGTTDIIDICSKLPREPSTNSRSSMDDSTLDRLARIYFVSEKPERIDEMLNLLNDTELLQKKRAMEWLIKAYGQVGQIDKAIETVASLQSDPTLKVDAETVDALVTNVFIRNNELAEGVAHTLGLCRTFNIHPKSTTALRLLKKARKDKNTEEEERILQLFEEFKLTFELDRIAKAKQEGRMYK